MVWSTSLKCSRDGRTRQLEFSWLKGHGRKKVFILLVIIYCNNNMQSCTGVHSTQHTAQIEIEERKSGMKNRTTNGQYFMFSDSLLEYIKYSEQFTKFLDGRYIRRKAWMVIVLFCWPFNMKNWLFMMQLGGSHSSEQNIWVRDNLLQHVQLPGQTC